MLSNVKNLKINLELSSKIKKFLSHFQNTVYCYIPDNNPNLPVIHSELLDLKRQEEGYGIFFSVNGFAEGKRDGAHLICLNGFFCDIDFPDKQNRTDEKILEYKNDLSVELFENELLPTCIVETKNGLHVYWLFSKPIFLNEYNPEQRKTLLDSYRRVEESILKLFDGDPAAKDASRVLRVPGTIHQKNPNDPFECKITFYNSENINTFDFFANKFLKEAPQDTWAIANSDNSIDEETKKKIEREFPKLERPSYKKLLDKTTPIPEGMRNRALLVVASACCLAGWPIEQTYAHFDEFHGLSLREIRKTIKSAYDTPYDFGTRNEVMQHFMDNEEHAKVSEVASKVVAEKFKDERKKENDEQKEMYTRYEEILAQRYPTLLYKERADFYTYDNGVYRIMYQEEFESVILREMSKDNLFNYRKLSAVRDKIACFRSLESRTFKHGQENNNPNLINLKNGLLDIRDYKLYPHTPKYLTTVQTPIEYQAEARCPQWFKFLNDVMDGDQDQIKLLQQIAGYCLTNDTTLQKAFIFLGHQGGNGKGVFTRILRKLVGEDNVTNLKLTTITRPFGLTGLINKRLNIVDEISGNYFESDVIKSLISGDPVTTEVKFRPQPIDFIPILKLLFTVNELPKINDTTQALYRRFIIIPWERVFQANPDPQLDEKLSLELPGILIWAIEGLKSIRAEGRFLETEKNFAALRQFKSENSPIIEFLNTYYQPTPAESADKYLVPMGEIYDQYRQYCIDSGYKTKSLANFSREIFHSVIDGFIVERITDTSRRVFVKGIRSNRNFSGEIIKY